VLKLLKFRITRALDGPRQTQDPSRSNDPEAPEPAERRAEPAAMAPQPVYAQGMGALPQARARAAHRLHRSMRVALTMLS
jgi:hypothetical protein